MFRRAYPPVRFRVAFARTWKRGPMRLLKWRRNMPSTKLYNLVQNDDYDTRIPLHPDEAFHYGITFKAKYIGTLDVQRPASRVEIVAAMRRVRYEFKAKGAKKKKVMLDVSTEGVRVTTRKNMNKGKRNGAKLFGRSSKNAMNSEGLEIMHHPIYRIFYVSHDSSDLKIFSYIARDGATNVFKCNVFKSNRKSQAMRIVRTVGQAFEVCHKMQGSDQPSTSSVTDRGCGSDGTAPKDVALLDCAASASGTVSTTKVVVEKEPTEREPAPVRPKHIELLPPPPKTESRRSPRTTPASSITLPELPECITKVDVAPAEGDVATPLSAQHQLQLLRERLEQQAQQTRAAVAQLLLLRDQLAAEQAARCEAQSRTHQLLVHNKELLEHIAALVAHLQEKERGSSKPISAQQLTLLPQKTTIGDIKEAVLATPINGNQESATSDPLINLVTQTDAQNAVNNNNRMPPFTISAIVDRSATDGPFSDMTNDQIQTYLISKFQNISCQHNGKNDEKHSDLAMRVSNNNQQSFQNNNAFPGIPPLTDNCNNTDHSCVVNHQACKKKESSRMTENRACLNLPINKVNSQTSLRSNSQTSSSKDSSPDAFSSDEGAPFILPLSHKSTLKTTGEDGRVRLIVPVTPSNSSVNVPASNNSVPNTPDGMTLQVPVVDQLDPFSPITRTTSEKVPNRSEMMTALRTQWTRHTTK